jgi:curved DNA-binding protein CbpA
LWGKLENQYRILGVEEDASAAEIKQAFREKAKRHHPDIAGEGGRERMQKLLAAYEILSNRERRSEYDRANRRRQWAQRTSGGAGSGSGKGFNYREYLYERTLEGDPQTREKAQADLIIFDLFHFEEDAAIKLWRDLGGADFPLQKHLDREDWMDFSYILAEELAKRDICYEAFRLLVMIIREERREPYFRHFAIDAEGFLKELTRVSLRREVGEQAWLDCVDELLFLGFPPKEEARWFKAKAEALVNLGNIAAARAAFRAARERDPKITPPRKLKSLEEGLVL